MILAIQNIKFFNDLSIRSWFVTSAFNRFAFWLWFLFNMVLSSPLCVVSFSVADHIGDAVGIEFGSDVTWILLHSHDTRLIHWILWVNETWMHCNKIANDCVFFLFWLFVVCIPSASACTYHYVLTIFLEVLFVFSSSYVCVFPSIFGFSFLEMALQHMN